jgi:uncharacterized membrane protein YhaH (DUF805 family)
MTNETQYAVDTPISHGEGIKSFFKNWAKWGGQATKQEWLHGFLFNLYVGIVFSIVLLIVAGGSIFAILGASGWTGGSSYYSNNAAVVGGVFASLGIVIVFAIAYGVVIGIGGLSLVIRRLRSAGVANGWIAGAILVEAFASVIPFLGALISLATMVCIWIICFTKPSIQAPNTFTFFDVLSGKTTEGSAPQAPTATPVAAPTEAPAADTANPYNN